MRLYTIISTVTAPLLELVDNNNQLYLLRVFFFLIKLLGTLSLSVLLTSHTFTENKVYSDSKDSSSVFKDACEMKGEGKAKRKQFGMEISTVVVLSEYSFSSFC